MAAECGCPRALKRECPLWCPERKGVGEGGVPGVERRRMDDLLHPFVRRLLEFPSRSSQLGVADLAGFYKILSLAHVEPRHVDLHVA